MTGGNGRAPVSVIVPTLNAARGLGPCLGALAQGLSAGLVRELIIADGGSSDGIDALADEAGAELVVSRAGRGTQLASGANAAAGRWLLFLHADTVLAEGWTEAVRLHMRERPSQAGYFRLRFDRSGFGPRLVSGWANARSRWFALPYGDQGLLVPAALYREVGGYPDVPLMEDVAVVRRLGRGRLRPLDAEAVTDFGRYRREGWVLRGARNLLCILGYFLGVPPERLLRIYRGRHG